MLSKTINRKPCIHQDRQQCNGENGRMQNKNKFQKLKALPYCRLSLHSASEPSQPRLWLCRCISQRCPAGHSGSAGSAHLPKTPTFNSTHTILLLPSYLNTSCSIFPTLRSKICPEKSRKPDCLLPRVTNECMTHGGAVDHTTPVAYGFLGNLLRNFIKKFVQGVS